MDISKKTFVLDDLFLGKASGETESDFKDSFEDFYYSTGYAEKVVEDPTAYFVLGRKGVGKTLLSKYICKKAVSKDHKATCISFRQFEFLQLKEFKRNSIPEREYYHIWQWCLLLYVAKLLIVNEDEWGRSDLRVCIDKTFGLDLRQSKILEITRQLEMSGGWKNWVSGKRANSEKHVEGTYLDYLDSLLSTVVSVASASGTQFTLFCDDLDDDFGSESYDHVCESLLHATVELNSFFRRSGANIKIVLLLRSDIFYSLSFSNLSKYRRDHAISLDWQPELQESSPLVSFILHKAVISLGVDYPDNLATVFPKLFPYSIDGKRTVTFFTDMTMGRPRDVICLLEHARKNHERYDFFAAETFVRSRLSYSRDFLNDIEAEMKGHLDKDKQKSYLKLIRNLGKGTFYLDDLLERKGTVIEEIGGKEELEKALSFLFRFGVIGNIFHDYEEPSLVNSYSWSFREDVYEPDFDAKFTIHLGLRPALRAESRERAQNLSSRT